MASMNVECMTKLENALTADYITRCGDIQRITEDYSIKELDNIYPTLVGDIFGITRKDGWFLRSIFKNELFYDHQVAWFKPNGPFFNLCYKLMSNNFNLKYEFPLKFLPAAVKKMIDDGLVSSFYSKTLKIDILTGKPTALSLNPFEYYMFHFAYHLVNPCIASVASLERFDTVYHALAIEYERYFLPCNTSFIPPVSGFYMTSSTPLQTPNRPVRLPTLFRPSVLVTPSNTSSSLHTSSNSGIEIWRSELVAQVFIDFWFSSNSRGANESLNVSNLTERFSSQIAPSVSLNQSATFATAQNRLCYPRLPFVEHMRILRNLLKHMHYFANSHTANGTAMDELRRLIVPSSKSKIYTFLRRTIDQWPLDSSYRIVLETWLTFIQPWRYLDWRELTALNGDLRDIEERDRDVDRARWLEYIVENLLAYTVVFRQVMHKFARFDLSTPKNAFMVHRIARVFSQKNVGSLIENAEKYVDEASAMAPLPHKWTAVIRQQMVELEGPGYRYVPMFGLEVHQEMRQFLNLASESLMVAKGAVQEQQLEVSKHPTSLFGAIFSMFSSPPEQENLNAINYQTKGIQQLEATMDMLASMFKIVVIPVGTLDSSLTDGNQTFSDTLSYPGTPGYQQHSPDTSMHTPIIDTPKAMKDRIRSIRYEGDPDLEPIRTTENMLLVRFFYQVSTKLNEMYSVEMENVYYRNSFVGRVARRVLCPPKTIRRFDKNTPNGQTRRVESTLPPRLSFRSLASHQFIVYYFAAILIAYFFDYGPVALTLILFIAWALFIIIYAFLSPLLPLIFERTEPDSFHGSAVNSMNLSRTSNFT